MSNRHAPATLLGPPFTLKRPAGGAGISTVCPSPTPFGLGLGPTNPTRINLPSEPSAIRWARLLTCLTLLMPAFALVRAPPSFTRRLRRSDDAPLPLLPKAATVH